MASQNSPEDCPGQESVNEGIVVPLDLPEFCILTQKRQADGTLEVEVIGIKKQATCPHCGRICAKVHDRRLRRKRDVALGEHRVILVIHQRRFKCFGCRRSFTEPDQACGRYRRTTRWLRQAIGQEAMRQPIAQVAQSYQVGPRFVQAWLETVAVPQLVKRGLSLQESGQLPAPRSLGIDEFARRKGHRSDTILCDLETRQVLEVSSGRKQEDVVRLLERLEKCEKGEAVSMEMRESFRGAVQLCLPQARIVADHFHVIQHGNKALKAVIARWAKQPEGKQALEGQSSLFLRNREPLSAEQEQSRASLASAFPEIEAAWQLKEDLRHWYASATKETAASPLETWIAAVKKTGPKEMRKALSAFGNWRSEILAFFDFLPTRLSNGFVEGKNKRTKALMRQGYGYGTHQHLR